MSKDLKPLSEKLQAYPLLEKRMKVQEKMIAHEQLKGAGFENKKFMRRLLKSGLRWTGLKKRGLENILDIRVKELSFEFKELPEELDGLRILHLSDTHADGVPGLSEKLGEILPTLDYDLCLITGDFRFGKRGFHPNSMNASLDFLKHLSCKHGVYAVLGNHDFIEQVPYLEEAGVKFLFNESVPLAGSKNAYLLGCDDPHLYECDDIDAALKGVPKDAFKLLAVHTPEIIKEAADQEIDLYLCGHTHGGQICLPLWGAVFSNARIERKYAFDLSKYKAMQVYTHNGTGASNVAARFLSPSELVIHTLRRM